ncbi:MAG: VapC toxin family PIN domain ribonuclease [Verrucomicrobiales bacterium]|nr:VapC toxin family PIN domain ribonuclease [Verrucomicrobiales bacterium]|tara:strand:+ start:1051 stop:1473 length:423 start_codon:yes stop_codon:yes gene_type:complete
MVLVDSSAWIEFLRPQGRLDVTMGVDGLLHEYEALLCGPVKLEVLGNARREDRKPLGEFFSNLPYRAMSDPDWGLAQENAWKLRDQGLSVPWVDVLIATLALEWGCRVYSTDKHFELMRDELGLALYEPGVGGKFNPQNG